MAGRWTSVRRWGMVCIATVCMALVLAGCGGAQKEATEAAVNAAQLALNSVSAEAEKYVPDRLKAAQDALQAAKDAVAKGDYGTALDRAQETTNDAKALVGEAAAKKKEWAETWANVSESAPKSMEQIKARLDAYSRKGAKLPEGMDEVVLESEKEQYEALKKEWADTTVVAQRGSVPDALAKVASFEASMGKLEESIGMK